MYVNKQSYFGQPAVPDVLLVLVHQLDQHQTNMDQHGNSCWSFSRVSGPAIVPNKRMAETAKGLDLAKLVLKKT